MCFREEEFVTLCELVCFSVEGGVCKEGCMCIKYKVLCVCEDVRVFVKYRVLWVCVRMCVCVLSIECCVCVRMCVCVYREEDLIMLIL